MKKTFWKEGEWNAICDVCGFQRKSGELQLRWDGLWVCKTTVKEGCWETRHPQEFIKPPRAEQPIPWTRPESADIETYVCSAVTLNGVCDVGAADCAICDYDNGERD